MFKVIVRSNTICPFSKIFNNRLILVFRDLFKVFVFLNEFCSFCSSYLECCFVCSNRDVVLVWVFSSNCFCLNILFVYFLVDFIILDVFFSVEFILFRVLWCVCLMNFYVFIWKVFNIFTNCFYLFSILLFISLSGLNFRAQKNTFSFLYTF